MRRQVLQTVAYSIPAPAGRACVRVGIDGVDGSGKTMFADELAAAVRAEGRPVVRVSVDDFHNVRAVRHRRGRHSPEGFWLDSFNYDRLITDVLKPFGPRGSRVYRAAAHDLRSDAELYAPPLTSPPGTVLIVDGVFLHRDELASVWDLSIFLDVPFEVAVQRMADRDGTNPDPGHPSLRRYVEAQRLYFAACAPRRRASIVIDNTALKAPQIVSQRSTDLLG